MSTFQGINYAFQSTKIYIFKIEKDTFLKYKRKSLSYSRLQKKIQNRRIIYVASEEQLMRSEVKTRQFKCTHFPCFVGKDCCRVHQIS